MPVNFSIKNVPDALADRLRSRAQRNRRSLQRELMTILEAAAQDGSAALAQGGGPPAGRLSIEQLAERARALFPGGTPSSVELIREQRDGRFGAKWARSGRNAVKR